MGAQAFTMSDAPKKPSYTCPVTVLGAADSVDFGVDLDEVHALASGATAKAAAPRPAYFRNSRRSITVGSYGLNFGVGVESISRRSRRDDLFEAGHRKACRDGALHEQEHEQQWYDRH